MFRRISIGLLLLAAMAAPAQPTGARLIVTYRDGPDSPTAQAANRTVAAVPVRSMGELKAAVVRLPVGTDLGQAIATLKAQPGVLDVQADRRLGVDPVRGPTIKP